MTRVHLESERGGLARPGLQRRQRPHVLRVVREGAGVQFDRVRAEPVRAFDHHGHRIDEETRSDPGGGEVGGDGQDTGRHDRCGSHLSGQRLDVLQPADLAPGAWWQAAVTGTPRTIETPARRDLFRGAAALAGGAVLLPAAPATSAIISTLVVIS